MTFGLAGLEHPLSFNWLEQMAVVNGAVGRLIVASVLGALVGIEREVAHKAAGIRTNLLICLGSAFFTMLSPVLAGDIGTNKGQVASNIVQGIGFLGAGLILHNRSRISGLTSAASVWVVASIGMACGAGLYAPAIVATLIVIAGVQAVGFLEGACSIKIYPLFYETRGKDPDLMFASILKAMDASGERLGPVDRDTVAGVERISYTVVATRKRHERLRNKLKLEPGIEALLTFRDPEED